MEALPDSRCGGGSGRGCLWNENSFHGQVAPEGCLQGWMLARPFGARRGSDGCRCSMKSSIRSCPSASLLDTSVHSHDEVTSSGHLPTMPFVSGSLHC